MDTQTLLIVLGGVALLFMLALVRGVLRRKPKRSSAIKKRSRTKDTSNRRSPPKSDRSTRPLADDLLDSARRAGVKPARRPDREVGRVANVSPGASIPLAWGPVEQKIERAAERLGANSDDPDLDSTVHKLRFLESKSRLSDAQARLLHKMRQLRNRAAHSELSDNEVDGGAARAYGRVAKGFIVVLDRVR